MTDWLISSVSFNNAIEVDNCSLNPYWLSCKIELSSRYLFNLAHTNFSDILEKLLGQRLVCNLICIFCHHIWRRVWLLLFLNGLEKYLQERTGYLNRPKLQRLIKLTGNSSNPLLFVFFRLVIISETSYWFVGKRNMDVAKLPCKKFDGCLFTIGILFARVGPTLTK